MDFVGDKVVWDELRSEPSPLVSFIIATAEATARRNWGLTDDFPVLPLRAPQKPSVALHKAGRSNEHKEQFGYPDID